MKQNETPKNSELATTAPTPTLPATEQALAAFGAYADEVSKGSRQILKFKKGKFYLGKDGDELPLGTVLVANMPSLSREWLKWKDGEVIDRRVARIAAGEALPARDTLGDLDRALWEKDSNGTPKDPWSETHSLVLKSVETGEEFRFGTGSHGGKKAIGKLASAFKHRSELRGEIVNPLVKLESTSYYNAKYKADIDEPVFKAFEWKTDAELMRGAAKPARVELDDEIPF